MMVDSETMDGEDTEEPEKPVEGSGNHKVFSINCFWHCIASCSSV